MEKNKTWTGPERKLTEDIPMEEPVNSREIGGISDSGRDTVREEDMPGTEAGKKAGRQQPEKEEKQGGWKQEVWEWFKIIISAAAIAFFLNTCIIANSEVPSGSMENTIMSHSRVIGSRLSYIKDDPERGDIVIFRYPDNEKVYYVKRVIGLPGETVEVKDGKVYINGSDTPLDEPYLPEPMEGSYGPYEVPEGCYFMMGDNRNNSLDARFWDNKFVAKNKIVAKVLFCYYPFNRIGKVN